MGREVFDWADVHYGDRPRVARGLRAVRAVARAAGRQLTEDSVPTELQQAEALGPAAPVREGAARVLVMSFRAWTTHVAYEMLVGHALRRRGADPLYVVCGGGLPIVELGRPRAEFPDPCAGCTAYVTGMLAAAGLPHVLLDELVPAAERERIAAEVAAARDLASVEVEGVLLSPLVARSVLWVTRSGLTLRRGDTVPELREFVESAAIVTTAFARLLDRERPGAVVMVSGLFFAEAAMRELAMRRGIRVVTYDFPGRSGTVFLSTGSPATLYEIDDLWDSEGDRAPTAEERERIVESIEQRRAGGGPLFPAYAFQAPSNDAGADTRLALFTNVSWDTAVVLRDVGFDDMYDWVEHAIRYALEHDHVELDVRIHPGEIRERGFVTKDLVEDYLRERFPELPDRIRVHGPETPVDSYALIERAAAVLVYASTIGLEAAVLGRPVLVAADVHYRGKGFTYDVSGPDELRRLLDAVHELRLDDAQRDRAIHYASLFFYDAMVELRAMTERWRGKPDLRLRSPAELDDDPAISATCDLALGST